MGKRGPYAKGLARREEIVARGLEVIAAEGYSGASVHRIASAAGLSKTGLLHHFDSKEQLFTEILRKRDEVDDPGLDELSAQLADLESAYVRIVQRNADIPGLVELFTRLSIEAADPEHPAHEFFSRRDRDLGERVARTIERATADSGRLPASAKTMALLLLAATDGLQLRWLRDPELDMAGTLTVLFELFEHAIADGAARPE
ncbi:TetR/AcrR family transcriptional regulator [Ruania albidiflava]|uniref:TetR/AcrR family transcriptional regulator n=1 Tax=Ruania albidiflava TaxID=366586 RepID=UPI0003B3A0FF|nr:TetR/AcrR family transcriptional regulator [Ruania albidiflava]